MISIAATPAELWLALRSLGLSDREVASDQEVQQLVYLLDRAGAAFGYRYKWEVFGPYSVELATELAAVERPAAGDLDGELPEQVASAVARVEALLAPPANVELERPVWLRLLMCVDFASRRARLELSNGDRPQFLALNFTLEQINIARAELGKLS